MIFVKTISDYHRYLIKYHDLIDTTIEGGIVSTNDDELYDQLRMLRSHGMVRESLNEETEHTCSLCCDIILPDQVIQTPCPYSKIHVFHKECFVKFRKNEYYNNRCPNCRSNVTLKQMIPKGTCNRLKESSQILDYEQQKLQTLLVEHKTIEMNIRNIISRLNIDISNIFKEKIVIKNNKSKLNQLNWRIEQKQIKQNLEKKNHKKYILELLKVIEDYEPNYYNSNTYLINQKNRINNLIIE